LSKFGSIEYHAGNMMFFTGIVFLLVSAIILLFTHSTSQENENIISIFSIIGIIIGCICIYYGLSVLKKEKKQSEKGIIIGEKEKHHIFIKADGNKITLFIDNIPEPTIEIGYFKKETILKTIGKQEKHKIQCDVKASIWTGEIDKYIFLDGKLFFKEVRPIW